MKNLLDITLAVLLIILTTMIGVGFTIIYGFTIISIIAWITVAVIIGCMIMIIAHIVTETIKREIIEYLE